MNNEMCNLTPQNPVVFHDPMIYQNPVVVQNPMGTRMYPQNNIEPMNYGYTAQEREIILRGRVNGELECIRHGNRMEEKEQYERLKMECEEKRFSRARRRELEEKYVIEDEKGQLHIQSHIPGEKDVLSGPIIGKTHLKLYEVVSCGPIPKIEILSWDGLEKEIILIEKECSVRGFYKALLENGAPIGFGRDKNRKMAELIYSYLLAHAEKRYMKRIFGWQKTDHGWEFAYEGEPTVHSLLKEYGQMGAWKE